MKLTPAQKSWLKEMPVDVADFAVAYKPCHKLAELGLATETPKSYGRVRFERTAAGDAVAEKLK